MRILLLGNFLSARTGTRSLCEDLAERLREAGWQVVTASDKSGRVAKLWDMTLTIWSARDQYDLAQIDVYSGAAFFWAEVTSLLLYLLKKPVQLALRGGNLPEFAARWPRRARNLLQRADVVTATSGYLQYEMRMYRPDVILVDNPIEVDSYPFTSRRHVQPRLMWLRAIHHVYNPQMAVRALAELVDRYPDITLQLIGPDKLDGCWQETVQLARDLDVADRVVLVGGIPKPDVPEWLNKGDIFLNTTTIDNTPVSVIEAMACGLCVISTRVGGIPYLLDDGETAVFVDSNDHQEMAETIDHVLSDPNLAERLSRAGREKVESFDWSIVFPRWEALLADTIARNG